MTSFWSSQLGLNNHTGEKPTMPFHQPCLKCGNLVRGASYCTGCKPPKVDTPQRTAKKNFLYGGQYRKKAKQVKQTATHCHLCGKAFILGDTIEADHVYPELGHESPLAPAHRKCNQARGNTPLT